MNNLILFIIITFIVGIMTCDIIIIRELIKFRKVMEKYLVKNKQDSSSCNSVECELCKFIDECPYMRIR